MVKLLFVLVEFFKELFVFLVVGTYFINTNTYEKSEDKEGNHNCKNQFNHFDFLYKKFNRIR